METPKKQHRKDNNNIGRIILAVNNLIRQLFAILLAGTLRMPTFESPLQVRRRRKQTLTSQPTTPHTGLVAEIFVHNHLYSLHKELYQVTIPSIWRVTMIAVSFCGLALKMG